MSARAVALGAAGALAAVGIGWGALAYLGSHGGPTPAAVPDAVRSTPVAYGDRRVRLTAAQSTAIGLAVAPATEGTATEVVKAPGQVVPDETHFVYITPRAAGVVRSVAAHEGQTVKAGDLLATVDSPEVAQARFDLYTRLQELEVARSQASWEETTYANTIALLARVRAGDSPDAIDRSFESRPVGPSREQLIKAYTAVRLARATFERNQELYKQQIIGVKQFDVARAEYESAAATYQSLTEQMTFLAGLARTKTQQALRKAETATRVARARLRMLGVNPDGSLSVVKDGKVVGVGPDGALAVSSPDEGPDSAAAIHPDGTPGVSPAAGLPVGGAPGVKAAPVEPIGAHREADPIAGAKPPPEALVSDKPVSTYPIWAPFDATVIDRMMIVPGVSVDVGSRLFTLTDLSTVWVEVHVHESDYDELTRGREGKVQFTSPAYPDATFEAEVLYAGDMVDAKTRTLRLVARATNPKRQLKPGMFVDVTLRIPGRRRVVLVPTSALLSEGTGHLVFVQVGPDQFERRSVVVGSSREGQAEIVEGLKGGDLVVTQGGFKLRATLLRGEGQGEAPAGEAVRGKPEAPALASGGAGRGEDAR